MKWNQLHDAQSRRERRAALFATMTPEEEARLQQLSEPASPAYVPPDLDEHVAECLVSIEEACGENPDVNPDDVAHDIIISYQMMLPGSQRREFRERCGLYI